MTEHRSLRGTARGTRVGVIFVVAVAAAIAVLMTSSGTVFSESGPFERLTAVLLALTAFAFVLLAPSPVLREQWHLCALLVLFVMRELDFDKKFTDEGVLQLRLYTGDSPLLHQVIGAGVVILVLFVLFRLARRNVRPWLASLRRGSSAAYLLAASIVLVVVAKTIDGLDRKLEPFDILLTEATVARAGAIEEILELFFALGLFAAVLLWLGRTPRGTRP